MFSLSDHICYCCGSKGLLNFYDITGIPVHSVLLMPSRETAINYPKGNISLGYCQKCGFISNTAFKPEVHEYSSKYEETQGFSPTFNAFSLNLAKRLIEKYNLNGKDIIEIGCGKGEFLTLLCELGNNRGIGFDPAYVNERMHSKAAERIIFIRDFYSEKYSYHKGDIIICKMTLEHIQNPFELVSTVRRSIGDQPGTNVIFQVPDVTRILKDLAFWDIYYEHCSYFNPGSLARLFRKSGFEVINLTREYDDQYIYIEVKPICGKDDLTLTGEDGIKELTQDVEFFSKNYRRKLNEWKHKLEIIKQKGGRVVLWGSGSKGVSFLTTLNIQDEIGYVVDINPYRHNTYMAGTGHEIVAPVFLKEYKPDMVIVMNPVYCNEIEEELKKMGIKPEIITV